MPTNVKQPVQLRDHKERSSLLTNQSGNRLSRLVFYTPLILRADLEAKAREKKNQQKTGMDSSRFAVSKLLCLLFFVPSDTMKNNLGKPLTGGLSPEGCFGSLTASFELFLRSRQIYLTHTHTQGTI